MRKEARVRIAVAREAARLMYEEEVGQYMDAKRMAARRVLGRSGGRQVRFKPRFRPSNGEIRDELLFLAEMAEGASRRQRLFVMRAVALDAMRALAAFRPGLIGSVSTGHVRRGSDIDLHVFTDVEDELLQRLHHLAWHHGLERVQIRRGTRFEVYTHVHVDRGFPLELSVYPERERRIVTRSSTDGRPIRRVGVAALAVLIADDHPEEWAEWGATGLIPGLHEALEDDEHGGAFDGFIEEFCG